MDNQFSLLMAHYKDGGIRGHFDIVTDGSQTYFRAIGLTEINIVRKLLIALDYTDCRGERDYEQQLGNVIAKAMDTRGSEVTNAIHMEGIT